MAAKKRYRGLNMCSSVLNIITLFIFSRRFAFTKRPARIISLITDENKDSVILVDERDLIDEPEKYTRLGSSDFLKIYREINDESSILNRFSKQDFYFSSEEFREIRTQIHQRRWRYYICLEQNEHGHWMIYMREKCYVKRPNGHKVICLKK
jgi:hypothetical protein